MLFYAGLAIFVCYAFPNTDVVVAINPITIGVAAWGVICCGLISIENRIARNLNVEPDFDSDLSIAHTLRRILFLPVGFLLGVNCILWPVYFLWMLTAPISFFELDPSSQIPPLVERYSLLAIAFWLLTIKCGGGIHLWAFLMRFHAPKIESSQKATDAVPVRWVKHYLLFGVIGFAGVIAFVVTHNVADFGLSSGPWILTAMIIANILGALKINRGIQSEAVTPAA